VVGPHALKMEKNSADRARLTIFESVLCEQSVATAETHFTPKKLGIFIGLKLSEKDKVNESFVSLRISMCVQLRRAPMVSIPKIVGMMSCSFVLFVGLFVVLPYAYAAHPQAEKDMSSDRGSQGNQDMIKGESGPAAEKGPHTGRKNKESKMKKNNSSAKQSTDHRNDKDQGATDEKGKGGN